MFQKYLRHGQVTVPKPLRKILGIKEGDVLEVMAENNGVLFKPKVLFDKKRKANETAQEKKRPALATTSFDKDWENDQDAIYDNWQEKYHIP